MGAAKPNKDHKQIIFVTGLSGAGLSSVLKNLEDFGYEVFDNFPISLIAPLLEEISPVTRPIAIGIDSRTRGFSAQSVIDKAKELNAKLLYIACESSVLQRRFTETRRRHPMAQDKPIQYGIEEEEKLLKPIGAEADLTIDTSRLNVHDLRQILEGHFSAESQDRMVVSLISFGFRHGTPREADIVMDVRFLDNPHWDEKLRPLSGLDAEVAEYIQKDPQYDNFIDHFTNLIQFLLPNYQKEGKNYLTIAIGCTGGRHRSVFTVESLKQLLEKSGYFVTNIHRDLK